MVRKALKIVDEEIAKGRDFVKRRNYYANFRAQADLILTTVQDSIKRRIEAECTDPPECEKCTYPADDR